MLSVSDFIMIRRATIGAALVEGVQRFTLHGHRLCSTLSLAAMIEYSLDLDIPDCVFEDPTVIAMSQATTDIMTWPNVSEHQGVRLHVFFPTNVKANQDLCSFNVSPLMTRFQLLASN
jgi:hypothetical protein